MIKSITMYSVICDRCGKSFIDEFNGIVAWLDEGTAKEQAMESEWAEIGDKHYCPDCYEFDDELDEYIPKKERRFEMKKNKHSLKISRSFFGDTTLDGYPIVTYSNDELKILKNLLTKVLCEVNEYIKD